MRWEALFADLESQFAQAAQAGWEEEVLDLTEAEMATSHVADRLRARRGRTVELRLVGGGQLGGEVLDAAPQWLLLAQEARRALVPLHAVAAAWPLGEVAPEAPVVERRLRLTHALRGIARDGAPVLVRAGHGDHRGWLVRVAADHVDLRSEGGPGDGGHGRPGAVVSIVLAHVHAVLTS